MCGNLGLQQTIRTTLGDKLVSAYRPFIFPELTPMWILTLQPKHASLILCALFKLPVPVAARSKAYVFGRSPAEIVGSNPAGDVDVCVLGMLCVVR
jgi:hypothetical protein